MITFYLLFNPIKKEFAKSGHGGGITYSINLAKHFTSEWSATRYRAANDYLSEFIVKKIQRY